MIAELIQSVVPDADVHATDLGGGDHWYVVAVSPAFEGMRSFQRQRPIMAAFAPHFQSGAIHALDLKCFTPAELVENHGGNIPAPFHPHADGTKGMHPHS